MRARWMTATWLTVLVLAAGPVSPALAHARLVQSAPAHRAVLKDAPAQLRLVFNSLVEQHFVRVSLRDADGHTRSLPYRPVRPGQVRELAVPLPALAVGAYRLTWSVVSADGHRVEGAIAFSVR